MPKIILIAHDIVGPSMAGPAIRYFEFAKNLAKTHEVVLFIPNDSTLTVTSFRLKKYDKAAFNQELPGTKAIISQHFPIGIAYKAKQKNIQLILDAYDPMPIEYLELFKDKPLKEQSALFQRSHANLIFSMQLADYVICANERQKDLWLGVLLALKKVNPLVYQEESSLNQLIGIVPFGLSSHPPQKTGEGLREKLGLKPTDKIILWGGGIWNWFDPLTLIQSFAALRKIRDDIHLIFMGVKHPNEAIPAMQMCTDAVELAKSLNLFNQSIHFNFGWVPYELRQNFLLEADIGISTHFNHLETHFAFRTRILDYLWAKLPTITSQGDYFADFIEKNHLGLTVPCEDVTALKEALQTLLNDQNLYRQMTQNIEKIKPLFFWEKVIEPLNIYLSLTPHKTTQFIRLKAFFVALINFIRMKGLTYSFYYVWKKLVAKI